MTRLEATDEQWEGLAEVVPLRSRDAWPSWHNHRALPAEEPLQPQVEARRLVVVRMQCFADARDIAEHLLAQTPVVLDLSSADPDVARRILDFSSGVVFGLNCAMHRVDTNVFLLVPAGTEVAQPRAFSARPLG